MSVTEVVSLDKSAYLEEIITSRTWPKQLRLVGDKLKTNFPSVAYEDLYEAISAATEILVVKGPLFVNESALRSWLFLTARHYLLHELRRARRVVPILEDTFAIIDQYIEFEHRYDLEGMLGLLAVDDRNLLIEHFRVGRPIVEIAKALGVSPEKLESRSTRAKKKIVKTYRVY
jgi:RNA polymerase sigma factor (sigma-70 family)